MFMSITTKKTKMITGCERIFSLKRSSVSVFPYGSIKQWRKSSFALLASLLLIFVTQHNVSSQCLGATNGLWPTATFNPICGSTCAFQNITTSGYASEYSNVNVVAGRTYTFRSNITTDFITISNGAGTLTYTSGVGGAGGITWVSTVTAAVRFYTHTNAACGGSTAFRTRSVCCVTPPPPPTCPTLTSPLNSSIGVSLSPTLTWTAGTNTANYTVYLSTNATLVANQDPSVIVSLNQAGTSYVASGLTASTVYYWRVVPKNSANVAATNCTTFSFTTAAPSPTLSAGTLNAFGNICVNASTTNSFAVSGVYLSGSVTVDALAGYAYSLSPTGPFTPTLSIPASGTLASTLVYVQFTPTAATAYGGAITVSSAGATTLNVTATGTGNSAPSVNAGADFNLCPGQSSAMSATTDAVSISGTATSGTVTISGTDNTSPTANYTFTGLPTGALVNGVTVNITSAGGTWCPSWYSVTTLINNVQQGAAGCAGITTYTNFNGQAANGLNIKVKGQDNDAWGDFMTITYTVTLNYIIPATYAWTPSTGLSSTSVLNPTCSTTSSQVYTLTVTGTNGCSASDQVAVTVLPGVSAGTLSGTSTVCSGQGTALTSSGATGGTWSTSDASVATVNSSGAVSTTNAGSATISYTVPGIGGCPNSTATQMITVNPTPTVNAGPDVDLCPGQTLVLNGTTNASSSSGSLNSGNITASGIDNTFPTATYTFTGLPLGSVVNGITVNVTSAGGIWCPSWYAVTTLINGVQQGGAGCTGTTSYTNFNGQAANGLQIQVKGQDNDAFGDFMNISFNVTLTYTIPPTYTWSPATGLSATNVLNPTCSASSTQTYTFSVNAINGCSASDQVTVTVLPGNSAGTLSGATSACVGQSTTFVSNGAAGGSWSSASNGIASVNAFGQITGVSAGTTAITYTVQGIGGCPNSTATQNVTINPLPAVNAGADLELCPGQTGTLGVATPALSTAPISNSASGVDNTNFTTSVTVSGAIPGATVTSVTFTPNITYFGNPCYFYNNWYVLQYWNGTSWVNLPCGTQTTINNFNGAVANGLVITMRVIDLDAYADNVTISINNLVVNCANPITYLWTPGANLSSTSISNPTVSYSASTQTYTLTATDVNGCVASDQVVVSGDITAPTITAPSSLTVNTDNTSCVASNVNLGTPVTNDNCTIVSVTNNGLSFYPVGTTTVTWVVTDNSGNSTSAAQTVTVIDNQNPIITAPAAVSVNADFGLCTASAVSLGNPTIADNCTVVSIVNNAPGIFPIGNTTVTWTITDASGNSASTNQTVTVLDNQLPTVTPPSNVTAAADLGLCSASGVVLGSPIFADNCGIASVTNNAPAIFPVGSTTVTWTVTDVNGNTVSAAQTVTVIDNQAPQVLCQNVLVNLDATGSATVTATQVNNGSTDNCSIASTVLSQTSFSCSNVGVNPVTLTVTDNTGNISTCSAFVIVSDITAPVALCQNITLNLGPLNGTGSITAGQVNNNSTDACGIASLSISQSNFGCSNLGANSVTLTVLDVNGNSSTCSSTITVIDNTAPNFITTPTSIVQNSIPGSCGRVVTYVAPTFFDACSATMTQTDGTGLTSGDFFPVGVTNQTYTITDPSGNVTNYTFTVTILDPQLPVITNCPANITLSASPTSCSAIANWIAPSGSDNCPGVVVTSTHAPGSSFPVGTTTVTYTVADASNNQVSCSFTVTVIDNTGPFVASLPTITGQCNAVVSAPVVTDNCTGSVTGTTTNPLVYSNQGTYFVTWTFTDANGNASTAVQVVIVQDNTDPLITAPAPVTVSANASCAATGLTLGTPTASDNCSAVTVTNNAPATYPLGTTIVTWTATDAVGNTSTASQIVTVLDNTIPTITAPANITLNATASCNVTGVSLGSPVTSDNCGVASVVNNAPTNFPVGTTQVIWTVIDNSGNSSTALQTVTVIDAINPTIIAPVAVILNANASCVAFNANLGSPVTADNCAVASITNNAPSVFPLGNTTVTWTATDASGNTAIATQLVTVIDVLSPTITAPATVTIGTNNACTATGVNLGTPTASDNCSAVTITNNAPAIFPIGSTTVIWTATDASGNSTTASQIVAVVDQTNPTIVSPADINVNASASCIVTNVTLGNPSVGDNCGVASVTNNAPTSFPIGTTLITWTVTDNAGNTATSIQTVSVVDNTNPTIIAPAAVTVSANSSCVAFNVNLGSPVTADNCSVASVSNNAPSVFPIGTTTVIWTVTDVAGNISTANQLVTVIDVINPVITAPSAITLVASGCSATGVVLGNAIASDNCSSVTITNNAPASFQLGNTTVVWTATDAAGNQSTANQVVTVVDQTNPTITAPVNITVNAGNSCNVSGIVLGFPVVADNCGVANVANDAPSTFPIGTTLVTWTIIDNAGNTATSTQTVTVVDNTNPIITAPANVTLDANSSCVAFNVNLGSPITTDNCAVVSITNDAPSVFELGSTTVTWTVTDGSGNSATATQSVTVIDNLDPEIIAPANLQVIANADCSATGVVLGNPIATDNCSSVTVQNNAPAVFPVGSTVVIWTATDASGNSSTAQQTVIVTDNVNPTVLLQDLTVTLDGNGDAQISFNDVDAGTFDNCGIASTVMSQTDFSCSDIGVNNIAITVVDNSGNASYGTVSITVQSNGVDSDFDGIDDSCDSEDNEVVTDVPEAFTPNGNNINDFFEIKNITTFNERKLEVFNRYGMSVYANDQYDNTWDGTRKDNGQALPDGTYYYVLILDGEIKKGFVYINRVKQ
jgi:gliding motility-associated-like protein